MAPPTPVLSRKEVPQLTRYELMKCPLKQLTQYECSVKGTEIVCVPFKRLFRACKHGPPGREVQKLIEVTDDSTNIGIQKPKVKDLEI